MDKWKSFWLGWGKDMLLTLFGLGLITWTVATRFHWQLLVLGGIFTGIAGRLHWKALGFGEFALLASPPQQRELSPASSQQPESENEEGDEE